MGAGASGLKKPKAPALPQLPTMRPQGEESLPPPFHSQEVDGSSCLCVYGIPSEESELKQVGARRECFDFAHLMP
jgi:hypothetical protein